MTFNRPWAMLISDPGSIGLDVGSIFFMWVSLIQCNRSPLSTTNEANKPASVLRTSSKGGRTCVCSVTSRTLCSVQCTLYKQTINSVNILVICVRFYIGLLCAIVTCFAVLSSKCSLIFLTPYKTSLLTVCCFVAKTSGCNFVVSFHSLVEYSC